MRAGLQRSGLSRMQTNPPPAETLRHGGLFPCRRGYPPDHRSDFAGRSRGQGLLDNFDGMPGRAFWLLGKIFVIYPAEFELRRRARSPEQEPLNEINP